MELGKVFRDTSPSPSRASASHFVCLCVLSLYTHLFVIVLISSDKCYANSEMLLLFVSVFEANTVEQTNIAFSVANTF